MPEKIPKKIIVFSIAYSPFVGGAEIAVKKITDNLAGEYQFDLITIGFDKKLARTEKIGFVTIHRVGFGGEVNSINDTYTFLQRINKTLFPVTACFKAWQLVKKNGPFDCAWAIMANQAAIAAAFFKSFKIINKSTFTLPMVLTLQEGDTLETIKKQISFFGPLYRYIFKKADIIQTISHYLEAYARDIVQKIGQNKTIVVVPNGVDSDLFDDHFEKQDIQQTKAQLNKKETDIFIVSVSRLVYKNAIDVVISALSGLPQQYKLLLVGTGPLENDLRLLAKKLKVDNRIMWLGQLSYEEVALLLKACDIFVRPSRSEGFGNAFIEAMMAGVPIIGTAVGGIVDFLKPGETGLTCMVDDPASLTETIVALMSDATLRNTIIWNARILARSAYDWRSVASEMKQKVFDPMLNGKIIV